MLFGYTAINRQGERLTETLEALDLAAAQNELMQRGLFVLNLQAGRTAKPSARSEVQFGPGAEAALEQRTSYQGVPNARPHELMLFTRQMAMLQKAGAPLVSAIQAIREQPGRAGWHALLDDLSEKVEGGTSLHDALAHHPRAFPGVVRSIVGAGEATGTLAEAFVRLSELLAARQRVRQRVLGALIYPCVLLVLAAGVLVTMTLFVLPRFAKLFAMLNTDLPLITQLMLAAGEGMKTWWPVVLGLPAAAITGLVIWTRTSGGRHVLGTVALRVPILGRAVSGVLLSQLLLMWAALLRSRVPVLDAIRQGREMTTNEVFVKLTAEAELAVTEGRSIHGVMRQSRVVPPPVASAVATGEESGRLGESMEFVGSWMEDEANQLIAGLTHVLEPAILVFMGLVVGSVCIALFLPLFEIATAAG